MCPIAMRPETSLSRREKNEKHAYMGRLVLKLSPYILFYYNQT